MTVPPFFESADPVLSVELIDRYLTGVCTPVEQRTMEAALRESPRLHAALEVLRTVPVPQSDYGHVDTAWREVECLIGPRQEKVRGRERVLVWGHGFKRQPLQRSPWRIATSGVAVIALICLAIGVRGWWPRQPASGTWTRYTTDSGQRARIELGDGTIVLLNVASRLDVPEHFGHGDRTVRLIGEADFQVAHSVGAPFTVEAAGTRTTVLGTEFDVRAYQPADVQVAVRTGRVMVGHTVLVANDIAYTSVRGTMFVAHQQHLEEALAFATGYLQLNDVPLREAIPQLDRWYDVDIQLGDRALGDVPISANFTSGSAGDLMDILRLMLDVRVVRTGRILTLYQR